jgi:hypothetical protein
MVGRTVLIGRSTVPVGRKSVTNTRQSNKGRYDEPAGKALQKQKTKKKHDNDWSNIFDPTIDCSGQSEINSEHTTIKHGMNGRRNNHDNNRNHIIIKNLQQIIDATIKQNHTVSLMCDGGCWYPSIG